MSCVSAPLKFTLLQTPNSIDDDTQPPPVACGRGGADADHLVVSGSADAGGVFPVVVEGRVGSAPTQIVRASTVLTQGRQHAQRAAASWPPARDGSAAQRRSAASSLGRAAARASTSRGPGASMGRSVALLPRAHTRAQRGLPACWMEVMEASVAAVARLSDRCQKGQRFGGGAVFEMPDGRCCFDVPRRQFLRMRAPLKKPNAPCFRPEMPLRRLAGIFASSSRAFFERRF